MSSKVQFLIADTLVVSRPCFVICRWLMMSFNNQAMTSARASKRKLMEQRGRIACSPSGWSVVVHTRHKSDRIYRCWSANFSGSFRYCLGRCGYSQDRTLWGLVEVFIIWCRTCVWNYCPRPKKHLLVSLPQNTYLYLVHSTVCSILVYWILLIEIFHGKTASNSSGGTEFDPCVFVPKEWTWPEVVVGGSGDICLYPAA